MFTSQKQLFDIPDEVAYLNTAYMSPLMHSVVAAIDEGVRLKAQPWKLTIDHFFNDVEAAKKLFGQLVNAHEDWIAVIPSASYGLSTAANNPLYFAVGAGALVLVIGLFLLRTRR